MRRRDVGRARYFPAQCMAHVDALHDKVEQYPNLDPKFPRINRSLTIKGRKEATRTLANLNARELHQNDQ